MADENEEVVQKGPNIILVVVGTALVTLLLGGGGLFAMGVFDSETSAPQESEKTAENSEQLSNPKAPAVEIEKLFDDGVTLRDGSKLVFTLVAEIPKEDKSKNALIRNLPKIKHEIILLMSDYKRESMKGRSKKEDILELIMKRINKKYKTPESNFVINALYFTKFDIQ